MSRRGGVAASWAFAMMCMLTFALAFAFAFARIAHAEPPSTASVTRPSAEGVVNVTSASQEELERLPGIGPGKAKAIVDHRHTHPFHKVEELTRVKGIGRKTLARLRPYLAVTGQTTLRQRPTQPKGKP